MAVFTMQKVHPKGNAFRHHLNIPLQKLTSISYKALTFTKLMGSNIRV